MAALIPIATGMWEIAMATISDGARPSSAAQWGFARNSASAPSRTTTGSEARIVESHHVFSGSYTWFQGIRHSFRTFTARCGGQLTTGPQWYVWASARRGSAYARLHL